MTNSTMWLLMIGIILLAAVYLQWDKRDKIHVTYHGSDKRVKNKWVKNNAKWAVFDGGLYNVLPDRLASMTYNPLLILPSQVQHADYRFDSAFAMNPETFEYTDVSPEAWNSLDKEKEIRTFGKADFDRSKAEKKGLLQQYQGLIMLLGFAAVGYVLYMIMKKQDSLGLALNVLQQMQMK